MAFTRPTQAANPQPASAAPGRSRYGGISGASMRDPLIGTGTYRLKITSCTEGYNPIKRRESYKVSALVIDASGDAATSKGSTVAVLFSAATAGMADLKRFAFHAAGLGATLAQRAAGENVRAIDDEGELSYDELEEREYQYQGAILEASAGHANGAPTLIDNVVDVIVTRGKDTEDGDYFRQYTWAAVPA